MRRCPSRCEGARRGGAFATAVGIVWQALVTPPRVPQSADDRAPKASEADSKRTPGSKRDVGSEVRWRGATSRTSPAVRCGDQGVGRRSSAPGDSPALLRNAALALPSRPAVVLTPGPSVGQRAQVATTENRRKPAGRGAVSPPGMRWYERWWSDERMYSAKLALESHHETIVKADSSVSYAHTSSRWKPPGRLDCCQSVTERVDQQGPPRPRGR